MERVNGPLHIKYRPRNFDEVVGNKDVVDSLKLILGRTKDKVSSYLFYGPKGCGKTTFAYLLKNHLGVSDMDFAEYNAANTRGIDTIRGVISSAMLSPLSGKLRIFFFDEVHSWTRDAENAALKSLEKPPSGVIFILCTTDPEKLLPTTLRRLTSFQLKLLGPREIITLLEWVCDEEKVKIGGGVIRKIVQVSEGCPGEALKILDQVIDLPDDERALAAIDKIYISDKEVIDICRVLLEKGDRWQRMAKLVREIQAEPEQARYAIMGYLASTLLNNGDDRVSKMIDFFTESFMYSKRAGLVNALFLACKL